MPKRSGLTAKNLAALGADELARALLAEASNNKALKRKLALMLSAREGPDAVAHEVRERIMSLEQLDAFIDWRGVRAFERELVQLRSIIADEIAPKAPDLAMELLWQFLDLSNSTLGHYDDSEGEIGDAFRSAVYDLGELVRKAPQDQSDLAGAIVDRLRSNDHGVFDELMEELTPGLDADGIARLEESLNAWRAETRDDDYGQFGVQIALRHLADIKGDVDAFIEVHDRDLLTNPVFASEIANRLVTAGRPEEALDYLDRSVPETSFGRQEWTDARIATFEALGRQEEAQSLRWDVFQLTLDPQYLRSYLRELPDFEDVEAELKALDWVENHENAERALTFLIGWRALDRAARLVETRHSDLNGDAYYILSPAADMLAGKYPLAAILLRRALVETTLNAGKSTRYKHAARHILEMQSQDAVIAEYGQHETHETFLARIWDEHHRKRGFWSKVDQLLG